RQARAAAASGQALSSAERESVLTLINTEAYADLPVGQIWARELDAGSYLCPAPGMYRIARAAGQSRGRRRHATPPAKVRPELRADGPSQVWTRDITKLRGPARGISCQLYVLIDIYSRSSPSWIISPAGDSQLATDFIAEAIERNGTAPHTVHADRGTSMTSRPVSALLADPGVTRSHSRPHVCPLTTRTQKRSSRPSSTCPSSRHPSPRSPTPGNSAPASSTSTTTSTVIPGSPGTPPPRSISGPPARSTRPGRTLPPPPATPTPSGSAAGHTPRSCRSSPGSTKIGRAHV